MRLGYLLGATALALATLQGGAVPANAQVLPPAPSAKSPTVAIGATGFAEATPDVADITAGLITKDPSSEAAIENNNREFAKILAVAKKYNIAPADLRTIGLSVRPNYKYTEDGGEELTGYTATNSVSITVRELKTIGKMLGDLGLAGANSINGPTFYVENNEPLMDQAREEAFDNAQRRALAYARKAGFKSVRLLTINESAGDMAYAGAYAEAAADVASIGAMDVMKQATQAPIEPGLVSETVYASFLFEMVP